MLTHIRGFSLGQNHNRGGHFLNRSPKFSEDSLTSRTLLDTRYVLNDPGKILAMSYTAVLVGHSFVAGLQDHFLNAQAQAQDLPSYATNNLRVNDFFSSLHFMGMRGASFENLSNCQDHLKQLKPSVILFDMATNDLAKSQLEHVDILRLASRYIDLVLQLLKTSAASHAYIFSCLPRSKGLANQTPEQFLASMDAFNKCMKTHCNNDARLHFHTHKGFTNDSSCKPLPIHAWSRDGIHPNTHYGRSHYKKSIRAALLDSIQHLTRYDLFSLCHNSSIISSLFAFFHFPLPGWTIAETDGGWGSWVLGHR